MSELTEGQQALQLATGFSCSHCYGSGLVIRDGEAVGRCCQCPESLTLAAEKILRTLRAAAEASAIENEDQFGREFKCAQALARATVTRPVRGTTLGLFLRVGEREVKAVIQTLRDEWHLPIGSLRVPPYGYYWISTPAEFLAWFGPMRGQALSELTTAYRLMRRYYPELAGQFTFNFDEEATHDGKSTEGAEP